MSTTPRLYVEDDLAAGRIVELGADQSHYLQNVLRRGEGSDVLLFNGRDGEWRATLTNVSKRGVRLSVETQARPQSAPPDLWLLFAPIKRQRIDWIAEKAAELGVRAAQPVVTERTNVERVNIERLRAHAVEAAEQCGLLSVPEIRPPEPLAAVLDSWPAGRRLLFCDESGQAPPALDALRAAAAGPWAVLIGPEGGFTERERERLAALPAALAVSLGPRIMRADTAAVAALALVNAALGDWR